MRSGPASRCRRTVRWTAFPSATVERQRIGERSATARDGAARLGLREMDRGGGPAGPAVQRGLASRRRASRGSVDLNRGIG